MDLIKQLDEMAKTDMDRATFERLVQFAVQDIKETLKPNASDDEMLEVIHSLVENISGFEDEYDAMEFANKILASVKQHLSF